VSDVEVTRNDEEHRYEARLGDELAGVAFFRPRGDAVEVTHTEVDPRYEGHGIGSALARFALDDIAAEGKQVVPSCPFVAEYIEHHPDYRSLVRG
jgi:predicted GNAT family acetyltransferase